MDTVFVQIELFHCLQCAENAKIIIFKFKAMEKEGVNVKTYPGLDWLIMDVCIAVLLFQEQSGD